MLSSLPALTSHPHPSFILSAAARLQSMRSERWYLSPASAGARETNKTQSSRLGFRGINDCTSVHQKSWSGLAPRCRDFEGEESDLALEAEILEFMSFSEKPEAFPSKKELINGGRMDLVEAIVRKRGWMSFGWDSDDDEEEEEVRGFNGWSLWEEDYRSSSSRSPSSSGRPLVREANESGIEGILNRLDEQRNLSFGFDSCNSSDGQNKDLKPKSLINGTVAGHLKSSEPCSSGRPKKFVFDNSTRRLNSVSEAGSWRCWSIQRAGDSKEVSCGKRDDEISCNGIRCRLWNLELELSTVLHSVRSNETLLPKVIASNLELELSTALLSVRSNETLLPKDQESTSIEIQNLTDAWELEQNETMNARDKMRSTRAKRAVFEGKLALALIEAQKIVEEKQRRVDGARRALQLLRSMSIVWPNSASEVLLAGSFDSWATKRKMEKSSRGIFSLGLQLYPGKYEIKFIVDGEWRIDPLRPTLKNNGFENNLLIVT